MENLSLEQLITKRTSVKAQLTKFTNYLNSLSVDKLTVDDVEELTYKLGRLEIKHKEFDLLQSQIELLKESDEAEVDIHDEIDNKFCKLIGTARSFVKDVTGSSIITESKSNSNIKSNINVNLPTINLPTFDGNFANWNSFKDTFTALVHDNVSLSDVQKLCYLRAALKNEPFQLIQSLETTGINYKVAFDLLAERFDHRRKIVYSHVYSILRSTFTSLKQLLNILEQHIRSLDVLNIPVKHWDAILVPLILTKLESRLVREWDSHLCSSLSKDTLPSYNELLSFLLKRADNEVPSTVRQQPKDEHKPKLRSQNFHITSNVDCPLCKKSHSILVCEQFKRQSTYDRFQTARSLKLCLNCLKLGHYVNNCKSSKCKTCRKSHHTMLHYNKGSYSATAAQPNDTENAVQETSISNCTTQLALYSQTLLSTAEVEVYDYRGNVHTTRALLDSASQSNFITESLANKLNLPIHGSNVIISGIMRTSSKLNKCTAIKIASRNSKYNALLPCLILPRITDNLPQIPFNKNLLNIPSRLCLADPSFNISKPIELLIGATVFWDLMENGQIKLNDTNVRLQKSKLGWLLSGNIPHNGPNTRTLAYTTQSLEEKVERFWKLDDFSEEKRRQILQNPIQIKKLQETLLNQRVKSKPSKKKKVKKNKKKKRELDDNIDIIIAQKLKALSKKSLDIKDLTTIPSDDDNLDKVLLKKFTKLKRKLSPEDYDEVLNDSKKDLSDGTDSEGNVDMRKSETVFKRSNTPDGLKRPRKH